LLVSVPSYVRLRFCVLGCLLTPYAI
jgi:hypothetical protein